MWGHTRLFRIILAWVLKNFSGGGCATCLDTSSTGGRFSRRKCFPLYGIWSFQLSTYWLLSSHPAPVWRAQLLSVALEVLGGPPKTMSSPGWQGLTVQCLFRGWVPASFVAFSWTCLFVVLGAQSPAVFCMWSDECCVEGDKPFSWLTSPTPADVAHVAGGPFCCPPVTPWLPPESSSPAVPKQCRCRELLLCRCRTLSLLPLNFIRAPLVHSPGLSWSLWMEVPHIPAAVPRVVSSANLISVHSSRALAKVLSSTGAMVQAFNSITKPNFNPSVRWHGCLTSL